MVGRKRFIVRQRVKGKDYWYFRRGDVRVRLPGHPGSEEFDRAYWATLAGKNAPPSRFTFNALIASYLQSPRFARLADGTKGGYRRTLDYIRDRAGSRDVRRIKRGDIIAAQEANADTPKKANEIVKLFSILLRHARNLDWIDSNPAEKIDKLPEGDGHEPWPVWALEQYREKAEGLALLAFELCLASGQRIGDVIRLRWSDFDGRGLMLKQGKTGTDLWVPLPDHLSRHLAGMEKRGLTILTNEKGQPVTYWTAHRHVMVARKLAGCEAYPIHGLRKNATIELLERGCTDAEAMAITGHSTRAMLLKYGAKVGQKKLAESAAVKRWKKTETERETAKLFAKPKNGGKS